MDYNDVVATEDNGLTVTFGTDFSSRIKDTYADQCGDNNSDECKQAMREVLGISSSANGVQRRIIGVLAVLGAVALAHVVLEAILLFDEARQPQKIQIVIPQDQKDEISAWDTSSNEFSFGECEETISPCNTAYVLLNFGRSNQRRPLFSRYEHRPNVVQACRVCSPAFQP